MSQAQPFQKTAESSMSTLCQSRPLSQRCFCYHERTPWVFPSGRVGGGSSTWFTRSTLTRGLDEPAGILSCWRSRQVLLRLHCHPRAWDTQCLETDGLCIINIMFAWSKLKTEVGGYLYQLDPRFSALGGKAGEACTFSSSVYCQRLFNVQSANVV